MVISNISSLVATPGAINNTAEVLGYYTPGDGGGGNFFWSPTSSITPNGGTVFSANGSGMWIKMLNGSISVKEFGAKGDGITDDTSFIQNAAKYVSEFNMNLFFPPAAYLIGDSIFFNGLTIKTDYSCSISAEGATIIKKGDENTFFYMFRFQGTDSAIKISGITFDGRRDQIKSHWSQHTPQFNVQPCSIDKKTIGISCEDVNSVNIDKCYFINIHGRGIQDTKASKYVTVTNSYFRNLAQDACVSESSGTFVVSNCHFEDIGILPETFIVNGVTYSFDGVTGGVKWYHIYGDGIMSRNKFTKVSDCTFININRIAVVSDIAQGFKQDAFCSNCTIVHDHLRLRCSNPQGSIWFENGYSGLVANNNIKYINRSVDDLQGYGICIAQSSMATEGRYVVSGNVIDTTLSNKTAITAIIVANGTDRCLQINNNVAIGSFIFCLNFSFQAPEKNFTSVNVINNYFDNTSVAANSSCISREAIGAGTGTIGTFILKGNFLRQGNLSDTRDPYLFGVEAIYEKNYIEDNNFNNASISLRYSTSVVNHIKGNTGVKFLRSLLNTTNTLHLKVIGNEIDYIQMQNQFGVIMPALSGIITHNKLNTISIHSANDLIITDNVFTPENTNGIEINPLNKNIPSTKLRILRNNIIIPVNVKGISITNTAASVLTNSIIANNTIDGELNSNTTGVAFSSPGNRSNVILQDNTVVRVTNAIVNPA